MKRILLVSPFPPNIGGVSVSSERLFEKLNNDHFEVKKFDIKYNSKVFNQWSFLKAVRFLWLPFYLKFNKSFDVIHFHVSGNYLRFYVTCFRCFFSSKTKFFSTVHGDVKDLESKFLYKYSLKGFDTIICVKKGDKSILEKSFSGKVVEIPAFIKPPLYANISLPPTVKDFFSRESKVVVINGFIVINKNYKDLYGFKDVLISMHKLFTKDPALKLLILDLGNKSGEDGEKYKENLKDFITNNEIDSRVLWYDGPILDFSTVIRKAFLFIRPTKSDGDALSLREALIFNIPTIASDIVKRPNTTILYDHSNSNGLTLKVNEVLENYDIYKKISQSDNHDFYDAIKTEYEY